VNLIPKPKKKQLTKGQFNINMTTSIHVQPETESLRIGKLLSAFINDKLGFEPTFQRQATNFISFEVCETEEMYRIEIEPEHVRVSANTPQGCFYGLQTLKQLIIENGRHLPCLVIEDSPTFENRGYYHDVTRGKVPTLETLKSIVDVAASFKLNQLQLYIEHTYLFKNQSEVWTVTDPLTAEEIMVLDQYCAENYIELVPSIATFGHLYEALQSESFEHLNELEQMDGFSWEDRMSHHTLNVDLPESIEFVKGMIDEFIPLVRSDQFNICADETFDLGEGKNKAMAEEVGKSRLYVDFLNKIIEHVKSHNKKVMFWGDIIIKHPEYIDELPKDLICLNWWYWLNYPEEKVSIIHDHGFEQYMCPGVNGWNNLMNDHKMAYDNIRLMADYGKRYNVLGMLNTDWGDYGHWNSFSTSIPGLIYGAAFSWGEERSFESMNDAINRIFFESGNDIMSLINEASTYHYCNLVPLVQWFEKKERSYLDRIDVDYETLLKANQRLDELVELLMDKLTMMPKHLRKHIRAYIVATKGIKLFNQLYMVIRKEEDKYDWGIDFDYNDLAVNLEYWLLDFKKEWYLENKYSEIYRIVEFIQQVNKWLRSIRPAELY